MSSPYAGLTRSSLGPIEQNDEDETQYLTLDLGAVDPSLLANCASIRLVGLETSTPYLQLGDLVFQGIHTRTLGTELVLNGDEVIAQSEHKVLFNPVQLIPRQEAETNKSHDRDSNTGGGAPPRLGPKRVAGRGRGRGRGRGGKKRTAS